jgi:hypothetical protein
MTSIRLTRNLKYRITNQATVLFAERIAKANKSLPKDFWDRVMIDVYDKQYFQYSTLNIPESWFIQVAGFSCHIHDHFISYQPLVKKYKMPHIETLFNNTILNIKSDEISDALKDEYVAYKVKIKKLEDERDEFKGSLHKVLANCNTLPQFLKVWPQGEHLIEDLDLTPKQTTRRKQNTEVSEETLSKLNTGLLKQTMLNS